MASFFDLVRNLLGGRQPPAPGATAATASVAAAEAARAKPARPELVPSAERRTAPPVLPAPARNVPRGKLSAPQSELDVERSSEAPLVPSPFAGGQAERGAENRIASGEVGHTGISITDPERHGEALTQADVSAFLKGEMALYADSTHHQWAKYYPTRDAMEFGFYGGRAGFAFPITIDEARSYLLASSKGTWFWDNIRIRGTARGMRKNWAYSA